jgi:L-rhamnose mutarotase
MKRFGWVAQIKPDQYAEYKRLHADVWPDVLKMITACNLRNYSIYHKGGCLFTYVEYIGEDFAADMAKMAADPTTQEWWALVVPMFKGADEQIAGGGVWADMEEIFHLD